MYISIFSNSSADVNTTLLDDDWLAMPCVHSDCQWAITNATEFKLVSLPGYIWQPYKMWRMYKRKPRKDTGSIDARNLEVIQQLHSLFSKRIWLITLSHLNDNHELVNRQHHTVDDQTVLCIYVYTLAVSGCPFNLPLLHAVTGQICCLCALLSDSNRKGLLINTSMNHLI